MIITPDSAWTFRAHLDTGDINAHLRAGNTAATIRDNVRRALGPLGAVARVDGEPVDNWLVNDTMALAIEMTPGRPLDTDGELARAILEGGNSARGGAPAFHPSGTVTSWAGSTFGADPHPLSSVVSDVRRGATGAAPTASRYTIGRVTSALSTNAETGQTLAGQALDRGFVGAIPMPLLIGGGVVLGLAALLAIGYALRPVAQLAQEA